MTTKNTNKVDSNCKNLQQQRPIRGLFVLLRMTDNVTAVEGAKANTEIPGLARNDGGGGVVRR
jgi:hypothetical protein